MSFWEKFRRLGYSMRWLLWIMVVALWLTTYWDGLVSTSHDSIDTIMQVIAVFYLIVAVCISIPPRDPPEK